MLWSQNFARLFLVHSRHVRYTSSTVATPRRPRGRPRKNAVEELKGCDRNRTCGHDEAINDTAIPDISVSRSSEDARQAVQSANETVRKRLSVARRKRGVVSRLKDGHASASINQQVARDDHRTVHLTPRLHMTSAVSKHHDLDSFLDYASQVQLNPSTNVFKGTHYEYRVAKTLKAYGFTLHRTGRSNDLGIDLIGHWTLPGDAQDYRVLLQCKAMQSTPSMIRELEGSFAGAPAGWNDRGAMALLATAKPFTSGVLQAIQRSAYAMGVLQITTDGVVQQFNWNHAAERARLSGLTVANTYRSTRKATGAKAHTHAGVEPPSISLMWMGSHWKSAAG